MESDSLPTRMRNAAEHLDIACALLGKDARMGDLGPLHDRLGLLVRNWRRDAQELRRDADALERGRTDA